MIGLFDSGHGGLTVYRALTRRFPEQGFLYLGDHANVPYGDRPSSEVVDLTRMGVELLFGRGCKLVVLACNTATAVACRTLQQHWLPGSRWRGHNVIGIVAPMVEAATQTPWAVTTPQYPQKYKTDVLAVFGTTRTIDSKVYVEEIRKRCPKATVLQEACADLVAPIEQGRPEAELDVIVGRHVERLLTRCPGQTPHQAILGCTHFPLVEHLFRRHLPASTRLLGQPEVVADSLEDYLARHPEYRGLPGESMLLTTARAEDVAATLRVFLPDAQDFQRAS
ncbi:MAG: aspartate/glutamate racemase family protein [Pseudomonadota bacterium]|nr:aspartate/glutamate racemase family protein [Pseudomonadota bacterium]